MDSFRRAHGALTRIVVCFLFACIIAVLPFMGINALFGGELGTYFCWGTAAVLLLVSIFSTISVVGHYLDGCQQSLNMLVQIGDQLESISTAVNRNNGREGEP